MDARYAFAAICCLSAFIAVACSVVYIGARLSRQTRTQRIAQRAGASGAFQRILQGGVPGLVTIAPWLLQLSWVRTWVERIAFAASLKGYETSTISILSLILGCVGATLAVCVCTGRSLLGLVLVLCAVMALCVASSHVYEARVAAMHDALPDALQSMSSCFGAGYSLVQTFEHLAHDIHGPLGQVFEQASSLMQTGATAEEALGNIRRQTELGELAFVSVALAVQHQTGGSMQHVLEATANALKAELELRRSLRVQTAQARLSARVVTGVTICMVAAMLFLSPDFLDPFFASSLGVGMLGLALAMQICGILIIRRLLNVQVG